MSVHKWKSRLVTGLAAISIGVMPIALTGCDDGPDDIEDVVDDIGDSAEDAADAVDDAIDDIDG